MKGMIPIGKWVAVGAIAVTIAGCNKANSEVNQSVITPVKLVEIPNLLDSRYDTFIATLRRIGSNVVSGSGELKS